MSEVEAAVEAQERDVVAPRSVLVAEDDLYLRILQDPSSLPLLEDRNAMVIPYSLKPEVNVDEALAVRDLLERSGQSVRNALLVKSPYDIASYELADSALQAFASAKFRAVGHVAGLLGARTVEVVETRVDKTTLRRDGGLGIKIPFFNSDAKGSREVAEELAKRLAVGVRFTGSEPRPEEALAYLHRRNLSSDDELLALIEMRAESGLQEYTMTFNGTRESMANLTTALELATATPVKAAQIGATFSQTLQAISTVEISTKITF